MKAKRLNNIDFSRNWLFISKELQKKISNVTVLCCGTGLGSYVAELLVRTGFKNLIIADGDLVSRANLNRQCFTLDDINKNKARALRKRLIGINAQANIKVVPKYLLADDLAKLIPQADYVINTIDFDHRAFIDCSNWCRKFNKIEIFPTNLGFGGSLLVFPENGVTLEGYFKTADKDKLKMKIIEFLTKQATPEFKEFVKLYKKSSVPYDPQLGISSYITATLAVTTILNLIDNQPIKLFPEVIYCDVASIVKK